MLPYNKVHLIAAREARREHIQMNIDMTKQVDIFRAINESKIPLGFQPLKNLSGAFFPAIPSENMVAGILINENHPKSRQRYTAAHELCHYLRDNEVSFDIETEIIARDKFDKHQDRERIAEAFAAWFLMPKELVEYQSSLMNINLENINTIEAYQLSLALGTSYSATVNHLYSLRKIRWNIRKKLLEVQPKDIKSKITGKTCGMGWNDVWVINESKNNETIFVQKGDELRLYLNEIPSTGYIWDFDTTDCTNIELIENFHSSIGQDRIGISGIRKVIINMKEEGICEISLTNKRPWKMEQDDEEKFKLLTNVEGKKHGINVTYLN